MEASIQAIGQRIYKKDLYEIININILIQGTYVWPDKRIYTGYFKANIIEGLGYYKWPDGRKYIGYFLKGHKEGLGCYFWTNGRKYIGFWEKGKQHGIGMYIDENNQSQYGIWYNGKRQRWLSDEEIRNVKEDYEFVQIDSMMLEYNKYENEINRKQ